MPTHQVFDLVLMINNDKYVWIILRILKKSVAWGAVENSEGIPISYRRHPDGTPNQRNNLFLTKKPCYYVLHGF